MRKTGGTTRVWTEELAQTFNVLFWLIPGRITLSSSALRLTTGSQ